MKPTKLPIAIGRMIIVAGVVSAAVVGCATTPSSQSSGGIRIPGKDPLIKGVMTSVAAADKSIGFRILVPTPSQALSDVSVTQTWVNRDLRQAALVVDHGTLTVMMWPVPSAHRNAIKYFRQFIAENHADIRILAVNNSVALVIEQHTDINHSNPAWVEFYHNGVDINMYSSVLSWRSLLVVARSMR